jgi:hypothetical protein
MLRNRHLPAVDPATAPQEFSVGDIRTEHSWGYHFRAGYLGRLRGK